MSEGNEREASNIATTPSSDSNEQTGPPRVRQQLRLHQRDWQNRNRNGSNSPAAESAGVNSKESDQPRMQQQMRQQFSKRNCANPDQCLCGCRRNCSTGCMRNGGRLPQSSM